MADTPKNKNKKRPKKRCPECGKAMVQQFIGLKHCKCGVTWKKDEGYFERSGDMVFALERKKVNGKINQVPVVRQK
jgi:hypothetical protein